MKSKEKHNKDNLAWVKKNRLKYAWYLRDWRKKRMDWYLSLKEGKSCEYCGESDPICLDFHHLDPKQKEGLVQRIATSTADNNMVLSEVAKCKLICANCHRKIHIRQINASINAESKEEVWAKQKSING